MVKDEGGKWNSKKVGTTVFQKDIYFLHKAVLSINQKF